MEREEKGGKSRVDEKAKFQDCLPAEEWDDLFDGIRVMIKKAIHQGLLDKNPINSLNKFQISFVPQLEDKMMSIIFEFEGEKTIPWEAPYIGQDGRMVHLGVPTPDPGDLSGFALSDEARQEIEQRRKNRLE